MEKQTQYMCVAKKIYLYIGLKIFLQHITFQAISLYAKHFLKKQEDIGNIPKYFLQMLILFYSCVVIWILISVTVACFYRCSYGKSFVFGLFLVVEKRINLEF
jgi:hypothetical protein